MSLCCRQAASQAASCSASWKLGVEAAKMVGKLKLQVQRNVALTTVQAAHAAVNSALKLPLLKMLLLLLLLLLRCCCCCGPIVVLQSCFCFLLVIVCKLLCMLHDVTQGFLKALGCVLPEAGERKRST